MSYRLAIFDLDGTILDTLDDLYASVNHLLASHNMPLRTKEEVRQFVGNGIGKLVIRSLPKQYSDSQTKMFIQEFNEYYAEHCYDSTKPYKGIKELIKLLRTQGIKTAVVSNKGDFAVQILIQQFFDGYFDIAVGEKADIRKKPSPDSVNEVLRVLSETKENAVYIGDSEVDIQTAKNAEMDCISVTYGFRDRDYLKQMGATCFAEDMDQLYNSIMK